MFHLHILAGFALASSSAAYGVYLHRHGVSRLSVSRQKLRAARIDGGHKAWRVANLLLEQAIYLLVGTLALTGLCFYLEVPLPFGITAEGLAVLHGGAAWTLLATVALHVAAQYKLGAAVAPSRHERARSGLRWLLKMLRPRLPRSFARSTLQAHPITGGLALAVAMAAGGGLYALGRAAKDTLLVERIVPGTAPVLDGKGEDEAWRAASSVSVLTWDGANLRSGQSWVEVQSVSDGERIYMKFRWEDPTRSFKHLPLEKTARGWRLLHEQYDVEDEDLYYEDKFAVLLSGEPKRENPRSPAA